MIDVLEKIKGSYPADGKVPFTSFEKGFRKGDVSQRIRVLLNWDSLGSYIESGDASIRIYRSWSVDWLKENEVFSAWYSKSNEHVFTEYFDPDAHPISHNKIDEYFNILPLEIRAGISSMIDYLKLRPNGVLPTVEIVTLEISDHNLLVLDGNHRVAAITRGPERSAYPLLANIVEYRIHAPADRNLVPDLVHYYDDSQVIEHRSE